MSGLDFMSATPKEPSSRSQRGLDGINFLMADVRDGVGPYLSILSRRGRNTRILSSDRSCNGRFVHCRRDLSDPGRPARGRGAHQRLLIAASGLMVGLCCLLIVLFPRFWIVIGAQAMLGAASAAIPPAIAALSLGIVGQRLLDGRVSRNEGFNHGGKSWSQPFWLGRWANRWAIAGFSTLCAPLRWAVR